MFSILLNINLLSSLFLTLDPVTCGPSHWLRHTIHSPSSDWANDFGRPWWRDESYVVGYLSEKTRTIKIINTLTSQDQVIEVSVLSSHNIAP